MKEFVNGLIFLFWGYLLYIFMFHQKM